MIGLRGVTLVAALAGIVTAAGSAQVRDGDLLVAGAVLDPMRGWPGTVLSVTNPLPLNLP